MKKVSDDTFPENYKRFSANEIKYLFGDTINQRQLGVN